VARRIAVEYRQAAGATLAQGGFLISAFGGKAMECPLLAQSGHSSLDIAVPHNTTQS
jgi:hypothetical protein